MLLAPEAVVGAQEAGLVPGSFYKPAHGHIYAAAVAVADDDGRGVDTTTVADELRRQQLLDAVGGQAALMALQAGTPTLGNARRYVAIVAERARERAVITLAGHVEDAGYRGDLDHAAAEIDELALLVAGAAEGDGSSWTPVDIGAVLDGTDLEPQPTMLRRTDGMPLLYPGEVHFFQGESESGKSWGAQWACVEVIEGGGHAVYVDFEDNARRVVARLIAMGADPAQIRERFRYVRPDDGVSATAKATLVAALSSQSADLVVFDGLAEVLTLSGLHENDAYDFLRFMGLAARPVQSTGAAVVIIDHMGKDADQKGKSPRGSSAKRPATFAAYEFQIVEPFARNKTGRAKVIVTKDKGGFVRGRAQGARFVANMTIVSADDGDSVNLTLTAPDDAGDGGWSGPTQCMAAVVALLDEVGGEMTGREIEDELRGRGRSYRHSTIADALARMAVDGRCSVRSGPRRSKLYSALVENNEQDGEMF